MDASPAHRDEVKAHLGFSDADIAKIPAEKLGVLG